MIGLGDLMDAGDEVYAILLARISFSATALLQGAQRPTTPMDKPVRKRRPTSQRALFLAPNERYPIASRQIAHCRPDAVIPVGQHLDAAFAHAFAHIALRGRLPIHGSY